MADTSKMLNSVLFQLFMVLYKIMEVIGTIYQTLSKLIGYKQLDNTYFVESIGVHGLQPKEKKNQLFEKYFFL